MQDIKVQNQLLYRCKCKIIFFIFFFEIFVAPLFAGFTVRDKVDDACMEIDSFSSFSDKFFTIKELI